LPEEAPAEVGEAMLGFFKTEPLAKVKNRYCRTATFTRWERLFVMNATTVTA
jgi:hypothetical protein